MAATFTLTGNLADIVGDDLPYPSSVDAYLVANIPHGDALIDLTTNKHHLGSRKLDVDTATGAFTQTGVVDTDATDLNVEAGTLRWQVEVSFRNGKGVRQPYTSGWFEMTADANLATLARDASPMAVASASQYAQDALAAQAGAEAALAAAQDLIVSDLGTTDGQTKTLIETPTSQTAAALSATIGAVTTPLQPAALAALGLRASLDAGVTTALAVIGDSTGNDVNEWVRLLGAEIAAAHPEYTVQQAIWNDTLQDAAPPVVLQTGTAGIQYLDTASHAVDRSLTLAESPHTPAVLDVRVKAKLPSWTAPAAMAIFASRQGNAGARSWYFGIATSGKPVVYISTDGTNQITKVADTALTTAANTTQWVRFVYTPSLNIKFFTSTDGATWTQLGATIANTDGPVFNAATPYELGGRGFGTTSNTAHIFDIDIRDRTGVAGDEGKPLVPRLPALWGSTQRIHAAVVGAPTITLVNGSHPGADLAYWTADRIAKALPKFGKALGFVSLSHNELDWSGPNFIGRYAAKVAEIKAAMPGVPLIYLTQNPQLSPRGPEFVAAQARRRVDIIMAAVKAGDVSIDTYGEFVRVGTATTVMADGIHPTPAGSQLWADTVRNAVGL